MAKFLNTQGLSEWMGRIIDETERELVIISPYLQLSDKIFQKLLNADNRGVELKQLKTELGSMGIDEDSFNERLKIELS